MTDPESSFFHRLRTAGITARDSEEQRLNKTLLVFATGLVTLTSTLWLAIYWSLGLRLSATLPLAFEALLTANLLAYVRTGNFSFFRSSQLALFLFFPFVVQWSLGDALAASGVILWGLLAPVGAILFLGVRESLPWFAAYVFLIVLSGVFDYSLADSALRARVAVPLRTSMVFFALNFIAVSAIVYALLRLATLEKDKARARLVEAHVRLRAEQQRAEHLLLNILPGPVAERLKRNEQAIADGFADVTVMFVDIVDFTHVAEGMSPNEVFSMLNRIFSSFDDLAERFGLEKIKTIGDAYMVAGGLDRGNPDYCASIAEMALAMRELLRRDLTVNSAHLEIRIGIGTGPVVAGVVGKKKFIYDLWGDTVNIASRITSEGVPGMIQVDTTTFRRLRERFQFHEPQTIYLKGKGDTTVYRMIGEKPIAVAGRAAP